MFLATRPSQKIIESFLEDSAGLPLSYEPIGLALQEPAGYGLTDRVESIGRGRAVFEEARSALRRWKHFDIGWVELFPPAAPIEPGNVVAVLIRHLGFW